MNVPPDQAQDFAEPPPPAALSAPIPFAMNGVPETVTEEEVQKGLVDLGFYLAPAAPGERGPLWDLRIDLDPKSPSFAMGAALYRETYKLTQFMPINPLLLPVDGFDRQLVEEAKILVADRARVAGGEHEMSTLQRRAQLSGLGRTWNHALVLTGQVTEALVAGGSPDRRIPPEHQPVLAAAALRAQIAFKFATAVFEQICQRPENENLNSILRDVGLPGTIRIAYRHRVTVESPLWRHVFPVSGELPAEYQDAFKRYDETVREHGASPDRPPNPYSQQLSLQSEHVAYSYPMKLTSDKIDQDLILCDQLASLTDLELTIVSDKLRRIPSPLTIEAIQSFNALKDEKEQLFEKLISLTSLKSALEAAKTSPELRQRLDTHGYTASLDVVANLLRRFSPGEEVNLREPIFQLALPLAFELENARGELASLQRELATAPGPSKDRRTAIHEAVRGLNDRIRLLDENLEALTLAKESRYFLRLLPASDSDAAVALARTASLVTRQAKFAGTPDLPRHVFDAVLLWLHAQEEDAFDAIAGLDTMDPERGQPTKSGEPVRNNAEWQTAAREKADLALSALGKYEGMLSEQIANATSQPDEAAMATRDSLRQLMNNIRDAMTPRHDPPPAS